MPTELYAHAPEILEHCDRIGKQYGLHDNALFHTQVTDLEWDAAASRWIVRTDRGDEFTAQFVGDGNGAAARTQAARHPWHRVLRWPLVPHQPVGLRLHRRRPVGRADGSAGRQARRHHRHRRDGGAVRPASGAGVPASCSYSSARHPRWTRGATGRWTRAGSPVSPTPGWQDRWLDNFVANMSAAELPAEDLVNDGWTDLAKRIRGRLSAPRSGAGQLRGPARRLRERRPREDDRDPGQGRRDRRGSGYRAGAQGLVPAAVQAAVLPRRVPSAFNLPSVHLVDTDGRGVERITPAGVVAAGVEYPVDCIIYASGFEVGTEPTRRYGFDLTGRDGVRLSEYWSGRDAQHARRPRARLPERLPGAARPGRQLRGERAA